MRLPLRALIVVALLAGCTTGPHDSNRQVIGQDECMICHVDDYDRTALVGLTPVCSDMPPDHPALEVSETCANCHNQFSWCPAIDVGDHPENCFPTRGPHAMPCLGCHDPSLGPSENGQNATCTGGGCHSYRGAAEEHDEISAYDGAYQLATANGRQNFCVSCHWTGRHDAFERTVRLDGSPNCP